jgi:hypothetical protein
MDRSNYTSHFLVAILKLVFYLQNHVTNLRFQSDACYYSTTLQILFTTATSRMTTFLRKCARHSLRMHVSRPSYTLCPSAANSNILYSTVPA